MNYYGKVQKLIKDNKIEVERAGGDLFETEEGKNLLAKIKKVTPKFGYLAEERIKLSLRKGYLCRKHMITLESSSLDLKKELEKAIKAEKLNPVHLLKRLFAA